MWRTRRTTRSAEPWRRRRPCPPEQAAALISAAQDAFTDGFQAAAWVGSAVLFATAAAAWFMLRGQKLAKGIVEDLD